MKQSKEEAKRKMKNLKIAKATDKALISSEPYELKYAAKKKKVPKSKIKEVKKKLKSNSRKRIYKELD